MSRRRDGSNSNPFKNHDRKTRKRYMKIVRSGVVPEELLGTKDGILIQEAIKQKEMMKDGWGLFKDFIKSKKARYAGGILATITVNLLAIVTPIVISEIVDMINNIAPGNETTVINRLMVLCLILVAVAVASLVSTFFVRYFILGASLLMEYSMRQRMFNKLLDLSLNYFNKKSAGEIMALSTNDLSALRMAIGRGIMITTNSLVLLASGFIYLTVKISLPLTIALMIPFPFIILLITRFSVFIHARFKKVQETFADLSAKTEENISGIRIIKSFVQEENEKDNFARINNANYEASINLAKINAIFHPSLTFMSTMAYMIVLIVGGLFAMNGSITLGEFIASNSFIGMLLGPVRFIGMLIGHLQRGRVSLARISELIFEKADIFDGKFGTTKNDIPERLNGDIRIRNLKFRYSNKDEEIFRGISTNIKAGQTVAIVGEVGSGKTTIANLLMRIFDVEGPGMIEIDGFDITDIPLKTLRDNIGYVPQDNFLFSDTIAYNIGFSEDGYSMELIEEAAKKSRVYGNIIEFPDKFNTMLGEKGVNLSGGQKQRLCIARALIKNSPILILDDCLSSVDVETEKEILSNLRDVREGRTCIIISHRVSTIKDSDKIIVLKDGLIAEEGSHDELVSLGGIYDRMYRMQLIEEMEINGGEAV